MQNTGRYRQVRASTSKNRCVARRYVQRGFARQQWRAWIETTAYCSTEYTWPDSPASNGGRGLKLFQKASIKIAASGFARQQWRAWIET